MSNIDLKLNSFIFLFINVEILINIAINLNIEEFSSCFAYP